jgi:hypothetical protein
VVTGNIAALKTETAEQSLNITAETMAALPNVNQDWGNFPTSWPARATLRGPSRITAKPDPTVPE